MDHLRLTDRMPERGGRPLAAVRARAGRVGRISPFRSGPPDPEPRA